MSIIDDRSRRLVGALAALALLAAFPASGAAFSALVAFGDSYTDTGNAPSSPPDYYDGRFSNGPLWVEYLSQQLGFDYQATNNFAVSGSESAELGVAIANFTGTTNSSNVLFAIWAGNNDFLNHLDIGNNDTAWNDSIIHTVSSLTNSCDLLYQKGARNILLFNQFDITKLPYVRGSYSTAYCDYLLGKITTLNTKLKSALGPLLTSHPGLQISVIDAYGNVDTLLANYHSYGFTNDTIGAINDPGLTNISFDGPGADYVFWDSQHPTTKTHNLIAGWVAAVLGVTPATTPPPPWNEQDIGSVGLAGSAGFSAGTFTVNGSGADIWSTNDAFQFVYQPLTGDGVVLALVTSIQNTDPWAKAGLMFRETLVSNSPYAMQAMTFSSGIAFQSRTNIGGISEYTTGGLQAATPYWLKLQRVGNLFQGYSSVDGSAWTLVGSTMIPMAATIYAGLAVTAHNNSELNTSIFTNVQVQPTATPPTMMMTSLTNGTCQIGVVGQIGATYRIDVSTDLSIWIPLATNLNASGIIQITDPSNLPQRFYHAVRLP